MKRLLGQAIFSSVILLTLLIARQAGGQTTTSPASEGGQPGQPSRLDLSARISELMAHNQYKDSIRLLLEDVRTGAAGGQPASDRQNASKFLMLGECYYLLADYASARPWLAKALASLPEAVQGGGEGGEGSRLRIVAEYRLACVAYRTGEFDDAQRRIDQFLARHPDDGAGQPGHAGTLLAFKMKILARKGKDAQKDLEAVRKLVYGDVKKYGYSAAMVVDQTLCDFYVSTGQADHAKELYAGIVHSSRSAIADCVKDRRPVPAGFEQTHDNAALQLGSINLDEGRIDEAVKWLENVAYDAEAKSRARLLLARIACQKGDFDGTIRTLTRDGLLDTVPAGPVKSSMYLLLGLAEKSKPAPDPAKVSEYLEKVSADSEHYPQAQFQLGELYREKSMARQAVKAYCNSLPSEKFAPAATFWLGTLYEDLAQAEKVPAARAELYRQAGDMFGQVLQKFPRSAQAKDARQHATALLAKGIDIKIPLADEEMQSAWEKTAAAKPGTPEAAAALISLARLHHQTVLDPKTGKWLKAPDYAAAALACDRLLDSRVYTGAGQPGLATPAWNQIRCEGFYYRGLCELASISGSPPAALPAVAPPASSDPASPAAPTPVYLKSADAGRAIEFLTEARKLADPKQAGHRELVRSIDLALVEAMLKSDQESTHAKGEKAFADLANECGSDPRFQKLAMDLAQWYRQHGRTVDAAREYRGIAQRGKELPKDDALNLLYTAGSLYSLAAFDAAKEAGPASKISHGIYIHPKELIKLDVLKSYPPLGRGVHVTWPKGGRRMTAGEALAALSKASGIPFVWSPATGPNSVAGYLAGTWLDISQGDGTVAEFLGRILDLKTHRLEFDIGLTGGAAGLPTPTIVPKAAPAAPGAAAGETGAAGAAGVAALEDRAEASTGSRVIEIYDQRLWDRRYKPLTADYQAWSAVHHGPEMMYNILRRIEALSDTRIFWADGVDARTVEAVEYKQIPGIAPASTCTCAVALAATLEPLNLAYRIVPRNLSSELYGQAKDCFNEIYKTDKASKQDEKALFALAINFYNQQDYEAMKRALREYLRIFADPGAARAASHYHQACFWVGWALERERHFSEAELFYTRSAGEQLVIYKAAPAAGATDGANRRLGDGANFSPSPHRPIAPSSSSALPSLVYDTATALSSPASGEFKNATLADLADFVRINSNVQIRLDPSAGGVEATINRERFKNVPCSEVLRSAVESLGLDIRVENADPETAERAYYRLAATCQKDGLLDQALANCTALVTRFPRSSRLPDACKLKLEIYKGLKDYGQVLATLDELRSAAHLAGSDVAAYKLDYEKAAALVDMCCYRQAADIFASCLKAAPVQAPEDRLNIRDGYARSLLRDGQGSHPAALEQYEALLAEETSPLRLFIDTLQVYYLKKAIGKGPLVELPKEVAAFIKSYEDLDDRQRQGLPPAALAKATWVYYVTGLLDVQAGDPAGAARKFAAAANSPDDWLAAEATYRLGMLHMQAKDFPKAIETFEYLLFAGKSVEAEVRGTYALGLCYQQVGQSAKARERFDQLARRYPVSPFAQAIREPAGPARPTSGPGK